MACKYTYNNIEFNSKEELKEHLSNRSRISFEVREAVLPNTVPNFTPYSGTSQWAGIMMRRVMQMAAQEGFDRVTWITGEQSADRYDLRKQVSSIGYNKREDGKYDVIVQDLSDYAIYEKYGVTLEELEPVIGKEMVQKIANEKGDVKKYEDITDPYEKRVFDANGYVNEGVIRGDNLKVGGEGMKAFYDSILPKVAKKEAQRFDKKATVEVVDFIGFSEEELKAIREHNKAVDEYNKFFEEGKGDSSEEGMEHFTTIIKRMRETIVSVPYRARMQTKSNIRGYIEPDRPFVERMYEKYSEEEVIDSMEVGTKATKQLSIKLTDKMKANLQGAIPLFQLGQSGISLAPNGFVYNGEVYYNESKLTPEVAVHEFGHLWNSLVKDINPELYQTGIDLIKSEGQEYINFVKKNQPHLKGEAILEEALAQAIGDNGAKIVNKAKKGGFRDWLANLWETIKQTLGITDYSAEEIQNMNLQQFSEAIAVDLLKGTKKSDFREKLKHKNPQDITSLGLYRNDNPYIAEKELVNLVGGVKDRDQFEALLEESGYEGFVQEYFSNKEFADEFYNEMQNLNRLREFKVENGNLIRKTNSETETLFNETLLVADNGLEAEIDYLNNIPQDLWDNNPSEITDLLESVREKAVDYGVNLNELEDLYVEKTQKEILDLLNSLKNVNLQPNRENVKAFAKAYDEFYQLNKEGKTKVLNIPTGHKDKNLIYLETDLSEYELFEKHSLLKVKDNVYQKVENVNSLDAIYELLISGLKVNHNVLPLEAYKSVQGKNGLVDKTKLKDEKNHEALKRDIKKFAEDKVALLNLPDFSVDSETLQKMVLYKFAFNLDLGFNSEVDIDTEFQKHSNFEGEAGYLKSIFIADFNKESIREQQKDSDAYNDFYSNFEITEKGITLKNTDPITMEVIKDYLRSNELKPNITRNLLQYSIVSKNLNLNDLLETNEPIRTEEFYRDFFTNNPSQAPKAEGNYNIINGNTIAAVGNPKFIRTPNGVYEAVESKGNVSFYSKLPKSDPNFNLVNVERPELGINPNDYSDLQTLPKFKVVAKKFYNNAELERINNQFFNCE